MTPYFSLLRIVHNKAIQKSVSYTLHYSEVDDLFYFTIKSTAPVEEWKGKATDFYTAVEYVYEWLDSL